MKSIVFLFIAFFFFNFLEAQEINGTLLLEKAIQYHDPNQHWDTFKGEFDIMMEMPESSKRVSHITINLPEEFFNVKATKDKKGIVINPSQLIDM